jgi:hypothetical protein
MSMESIEPAASENTVDATRSTAENGAATVVTSLKNKGRLMADILGSRGLVNLPDQHGGAGHAGDRQRRRYSVLHRMVDKFLQEIRAAYPNCKPRLQIRSTNEYTL